MGGMTLLNWWLHTVIGGGLVLLVAGAVMARTRQPARQLRVAEWAVLAALLVTLLSLAPSWLPVPIVTTAPPAEDQKPAPVAAVRPEPPPIQGGQDDIVIEVDPSLFVQAMPPTPSPDAAPPDKPPTKTVAAAPPAPPWWTGERVVFLLLFAHLAGAAFLIVRLLLGYLGLWRLARAARPAPERVARLFAEVAGERRRVQLLTSERIGIPFSCGLLRPTVLLPAELCDAPDDVLRWVLMHELAHLERRDAWSSLLVGLGRALWFFLPWYGWLRRRVRLCQEYLADAAAVAAGRAEDYAEFLVGWAAAPPTPAGAAGVFGHSSDLYRRITMLLQSPVPVERRCPARWSLVAGVGLLAAAVVAGGIGLKAYAAPVPKKDEPAKEQPKKDEPKKDEKAKPAPIFPDFDGAFPNLPLNPDDFRKQIEEIQKQQRQAMEDLARAIQAQQAALGRVPNIRLVPGGLGFGRNARGTMHEGRLGALVDVPNPTLIDQLDLPKDQGLIVEDVLPDSAAAKAGVKAHDILLELNGKAVPSKPEDFLKQLDGIKANTPVDAVVMRKGKKETVKGLSLPEAPKDVPGVPGAPRNLRRGAIINPLGPGVIGLPGMAGLPGIAGLPGANGFPGLPGAAVVPGMAGLPGIAGLPGANGFPGLPGAAVGRGVTVSVTRNGDQVSAHYRDEAITVVISGKLDAGRLKLDTLTVQEGNGAAVKYDSIDKVPEKYRDKVKKLIEGAETGNVRAEVRP
jgi:beta-lactamase regulating signal transducer with metallopeptidase domain